MKISLLTDAPKHNLALMKLSAYHKGCGDSVMLNGQVFSADYRYASVLFDKNIMFFNADEFGGPAFESTKLHPEIESLKPDYDLYPSDYSIGYTYRPCSNTCHFCKVPEMDHPDIEHHSIWEFHDSKFKKIRLMNNNTFQDPRWKETFEEIWDADLTIIDENGYDIRLLDDEKAKALYKTKWSKNRPGFAWDRIQDEGLILHGMQVAKKHKLLTHDTNIFVLIGYDTSQEQDIHRCQKIIDFGARPYIMPYERTDYTRRFKRFIDTFMWRKYKTIETAWNHYKKA